MDWQPCVSVRVLKVTAAFTLSAMLFGCRSMCVNGLSLADDSEVSRVVNSYRARMCGVESVRLAKFQLTTNGDMFAGDFGERLVGEEFRSALHCLSRFVCTPSDDADALPCDIELAAWLNMDQHVRFSSCGENIEINCRAVAAVRDKGRDPVVIYDGNYAVYRNSDYIAAHPVLSREAILAEIVKKFASEVGDVLDATFPLSAPVRCKLDDSTFVIGRGAGDGFRVGDSVVVVAQEKGDCKVLAIGDVDPESGSGRVKVCRWADDDARASMAALPGTWRVPDARRLVAIRL